MHSTTSLRNLHIVAFETACPFLKTYANFENVRVMREDDNLGQDR